VKTKKTSLDEKGDIDEELTPDLAEMEAELKKQIKPNNQ